MSKEKDNLFELIKSMTKSEKRYFKLFSSLHIKGDANNYMQLFDVIEGQKEYNDNEVKSAFKPESPILKQYIYNRFYLQKLILKSLVAFHKKSSIQATINEEIEMAQVLMKKELYKTSLKILNNAEKLCEKYTLTLKQLEVRLIKRKLFSHFGFKNIAFKDMIKYHNENSKILDFIKNTIQLDYYDSQISLRVHKEQSKLTIDLNKIEEKLKPFNKIGKNSDNLFQLYGIYSILYYAQGNKEKSLEYLKKCHTVLIKDKYLIEKNPQKYIALLNNICVLNIDSQKYSEALLSLEELEKFAIKYKNYINPIEQTQIHVRVFSGKITVYNMLGDFDKSYHIIDSYKHEIDKIHTVKDAHWFDINISCFYCYFVKKDYTKALKYIDNIINVATKNDLKRNAQAAAKLLEIITHYELENILLLEHLIRGTIRFLTKIKKFGSTANLITKSFTQLYKAKKGSNVKTILLELKNGLKKYDDMNFPQYFDLYSWIDSKIENKPFSLKVKENIK